MPLTESDLNSAIIAMEKDFEPYIRRMQVRRLLIERLPELAQSNALGINVPKPFDKSSLIVQTITGDVVDGVQHYAARIAANPPQPLVPKVTRTSRLSNRVEETAAEQERLLSALWDAADGSRKQYQVAWSQSWCRVGWYLTLPRDLGWGLPDRNYFEDLTDDALAAMRASDDLAPEPADDGRWPEGGSAWLSRRKDAARDNALSGRSLFTLEAIAGDMVRYRFDRDGLKFAYVVEECPGDDFRPGSESMRDLASRLGYKGSELAHFGVRVVDGRIVAGVTIGGERDSNTGATTFNFIRAFDRDCVYYMVTSAGAPTGGHLLWKGYHGAGRVPLVPVPGIWTDSRRPGGEFSCPMESVFALAPLLNQVETLLSNAAAFNAIPRWVIEKADGSLVVDEQGSPKEIGNAPTPGLDPSEAQVVEGNLRQLTIDASLLFELLKVYAEQMERAMPPDAARGEGGTSGAAWTVRQLLSAAQADLEQPVSNNAAAVRDIMQMWVRWMRLLDTPVYCLSIPRQRGSAKAVRGLIEFEPEDLIEGFEVVQSKDSASDRIVLQQHGLELYMQAQVIDARRYFEEYAHEPDPLQAEKDMWAERLVSIVMGVGPPAPPGSLLAQLVKAVQGRVFLEVQKRFPNSAILTAQLMAEQAAMQQQIGQPGMTVSETPTNMQPQPGAGNVAEANGMRQPGIGASTSLPGTPMSGLAAQMGAGR